MEAAMLHIVTDHYRSDQNVILRSMFKERKRVFVDMLGWNIPVIGDCEIDQFDTPDAHYLIITDPITNQHKGSLRLLPTTAPHILADLFPHLCEEPAPRGPDIFEITRLCLSPSLRAKDRRLVRNQLATALVHYAGFLGITRYTGVGTLSWLSQVLAMGWRALPLGFPQASASGTITALEIHIEPDSLRRLEEAGSFALCAWSYSASALQRAA
jgi:N-acyl-L-homoserine lactone synthetase